jgi:hypothetical protein
MTEFSRTMEYYLYTVRSSRIFKNFQDLSKTLKIRSIRTRFREGSTNYCIISELQSTSKVSPHSFVSTRVLKYLDTFFFFFLSIDSIGRVLLRHICSKSKSPDYEREQNSTSVDATEKKTEKTTK